MKKETKKIKEKKMSEEEKEEIVMNAVSDLFTRDLIEIYQTRELSVFKNVAKHMGLDEQQIEDTIKDLKKLKEE